jgi:alkaline phosphatase D
MASLKTSQFHRRHFLQGLMATPFLFGVGPDFEEDPILNPELHRNRRTPMLQTWADETSALVVVLGHAGWIFKSQDAEVSVVKSQKISGTEFELYRLHFKNLSSSTYSRFQIVKPADPMTETRSLKGLDLNAPAPKIAVASCSNFRRLHSQEAVYGHLQQQRPDLIFFTGDLVYANSQKSSLFGFPENPSSALGRYIMTWRAVNLYQLEPLIPTLATWDDHDYGANDGDHTHPYKDTMQNIFRSFYAMPESHQRLSRGPGVSFKLSAFGIDFFMLDGRSHRVKKKSQWGTHQEAWLAQEYTSNQRPAWILNGVQYFRYFVLIESVEKSAKPSLIWLKSLLRQHQKPTVLFSGDVHGSQVQELSESIFGYKTFEITSSGIHCNHVGPLLRRKRDEGQIFYCGKDNFLIVRPMVVSSTAMDLEIACANSEHYEEVASAPLRVEVTRMPPKPN